MTNTHQVYLAVDMGASSGRHVAGLFDGQSIQLAEVHRFENGPVIASGRMYWDVLALWSHIQEGLRAAAKAYPNQVVSLGVDTWGVDFGLLGRGDELLGNPYNYRDARTCGMFEKTFELVPRAEIFAETGLQFMEINTLYHLVAMKLQNSPLLEMAESLLMMPDLFHWLLTGEKANELTDVSTTQLYNPRTQNWSSLLIEKLGLPAKIFGQIVQPGTKLGQLRSEVANATGLSGVEVVLPGTHDTASAVLAVPAETFGAEKPDWCYISSGTWSLMGVELAQPVINDACAEFNFTNEGGIGGTTRLLKNIAGLWIVQECRRIWNQQGQHYTWDDLTRMAMEAPPLVAIVNPDDPRVVAPPDMPSLIRTLASEKNQPVPQEPGAVIRCALESLALRYRQVHRTLETLTGGSIGTVHIVGGGTRNKLLCQMTADACGRRVVAGPVEATALGNIMMQAVAAGAVGSVADARRIIRESFPVEVYEPQNAAQWEEASARFEQIVKA
jgi:rhamnulokinase